jgi:putative FmdB family regulatory protein
MPLYEYACTACDHRFERLTTIAAADEVACPECSGAPKRLLSVIAGQVGTASAPAPTCGGGACAACS